MIKRIMLTILALSVVFGTPLAFATGSLPGTTGWWTTEIVQNVSGMQTGGAVGTGSSAAVQVSAYAGGVGAVPFAATSGGVADGGAATFIPSDFSGMPSGFSGGGVVSSDQPIVAVGYITNARLGTSYGVQGGKAADYFQGMSEPSTTLYFSNAKNKWCNTTILYYVQNAGSVATTVSVTYTMGSTQGADFSTVYAFTTPSIEPNQMTVVSPADAGVPIPANNCDMNHQINLGSALLTASQPIAAMYIEYRTIDTTTAQSISVMRAFTPNDVGTMAFSPSVKYNWYNRRHGIPILNVDSVPITVTVTYKGQSGSCANKTFTDVVQNLAPGKSGRIVMAAGYTTVPATCVAAGTFVGTTATGAGGKFLAIMNENNLSGLPTGSVYYAFSSDTATKYVAAPIYKDMRTTTGIPTTTGFQVQNTSATTATISATFNCLGGPAGTTPFTAVTSPILVPPQAAQLFNKISTTPAQKALFTAGNPFSLSNAVCSVSIVSDQTIVGLINETSNSDGVLDDARYNAFNVVGP
jgi:hypothetical protein